MFVTWLIQRVVFFKIITPKHLPLHGSNLFINAEQIVMHHITNIRHFLLPCFGQIRTKSVIFGQGHLIALFATCGLLFAATITDKEDFQ